MRSITLKAIFTLLLTALMGALIYWVGTLPPIVIQTPTEPQPSTSVTTIPTHSSTAPHIHDFTYRMDSDNDCHWNVCICGFQNGVTGHTDLNGDQACDVCLAAVAPHIHIHSFPASWNTDENDHWHSCLCGEKNEIAPHMDLDGSQTCDVCEAIVPASLHQHNFGSSWYFYEGYHWRSCLCGETIDIAAHTDLDGDRTCDTCTVAVPSTLHQHLFVEDWDSDETDHWHTCLCGERNEILPHEDLNGDLLCDICEATVPSTLHQHLFAIDWTFDETDHWHSCLCGERDEVMPHEDADGDVFCDICQRSVSPDFHQHQFDSSWESGEDTHWHSCLCGEHSEEASHEDADGNQFCDICQASVPETLHQHLFADQWTTNNDSHWHSCRCGEQSDVGVHTDLDGDVRCDTCQDRVSPLLHQHQFSEEWNTSDSNHWHSCRCGEQITVAAHTDVNGDQRCDTCDMTVSAALHQHNPTADWHFNDAKHWHSCLCGEQTEIAAHTDVNGDQRCDTCDMTVSAALHQHLYGSSWESGEDTHWHSCLCGEHSKEASHEDADGNLFCDICQASVPETLHQHLFADQWTTNNDSHWHRCLCGEQSDVGAHTDLDGDVRCDTCQDRVSPLLHQHQFSEEWNTSDSNHWHSCLCGEQSAVAAHTDVNGDQFCDTCEVAVAASLHQHHYGDLWQSNGAEHWQICLCGQESTPAAHMDLDSNSFCDTCAYVLISANSAFVYDCAQESYLFQNPPMDLAVYPASITKVFTAYVALQYLDPADVIVLGQELTLCEGDALRAGFVIGDQVSVDILLHGLLMKSGGDCAYGLAAAAGRKILNDETADANSAVAAFLEEMNQQAQSLEMGDTNFLNPDGYDEENHIVSFHAFVTIAKCAMENSTIMEICGKKTITMYYTSVSGSNNYMCFKNTNALLDSGSSFYIPECIGLKTGTTDSAGFCFLGVFLHEGEYVIIGVFGCASDDQRWQDMHTLWNYYLTNQA